MKKYLLGGVLFLFLLTTLFVSLFFYGSNQSSPHIIIQPIQTIDLLYNKTGISARELSIQYPKAGAIVNGGYFGYTPDGFFVPAGKFVLSGVDATYFPPNSHDKNLTVFIQSDGKNLRASDEEPVMQGGSGFLIQVGPRLIRSGVVNTDVQNDYTHRNKQFVRTFLMIDGTGYSIGITIDTTSLIDLATLLTSYCKTNLCQAINLDGGPSTAMIQESSGIAINNDEKLPLRFVIDQYGEDH